MQQIVFSERQEKKKIATEALLWLKRGLEFTCLALRTNLDTPGEELSVSFTKAYGTTLSKHHSFMVRPIFSLAMNACPSRVSFYESLAHGDVPKVTQQLNEWVKGLEEKLANVVAFYEKEKLA